MRPSLLPRLLLPVLACLAVVSVPAHADGNSARYAASGTAVVRTSDGTVADNGAVVCDSGDGVGGGGLCLPFGGGDAVHVVDDTLGEDVAFQVCIDNNGDDFCTADDPDPLCPDVIAFSHDDAGTFHNPVGPVPTGFTAGCPGGSWRGYVVLLCQGAHAAGTPHAHPGTTGTGVVTSGGEGVGTFCGGTAFSSKPYRVSGGGNLTCGMTAFTDPATEGGDVMTGTMLAGPWHHAGAALTIECSVRIGGITVRNGASASGSGTTAAYLPPTLIAFVAPPGLPVYLCTEIEWTGPDGHDRFTVDMDPGTAGTQCALAVESGSATFRSVHVAQTAA